MKKIHKLVLKAYLGPLVVTFFIITFILMMNFVWRYIDELVGKGLEPSVIAELLMYATMNMVPMGLPLAILLATIMAMGNLGENHGRRRAGADGGRFGNAGRDCPGGGTGQPDPRQLYPRPV